MTTHYFKFAHVAIIAGIMVTTCKTSAYAQGAAPQEFFGQAEDESPAEKYVARGYAAGKNNFYELAIEYYKKAIEVNPNFVKAYRLMGLAYSSLENDKEAIKCYKKAIAIDPNDEIAHYQMGLTYYNLKNFREAIKCYKKAIAINPNYAAAYCNMGLLYYSYLRDYFEAIDYYQKAIDADPNFAEAYYHMGTTYADLVKGDNPKQIQYYRIAASLGSAEAQEWLQDRGHKW